MVSLCQPTNTIILISGSAPASWIYLLRRFLIKPLFILSFIITPRTSINHREIAPSSCRDNGHQNSFRALSRTARVQESQCNVFRYLASISKC
ncbi:unnamed protein product [Fusarium graminearum]|nr:unnamed protein product [Fusarium graminearum]CAG1966487.1 unnamed protein product [Fusarium graminearum]VTO85743.1 unnamed protein product [Fusarium graminearum]